MAIIQRALPLSTVWPLAATLLQKVRSILQADFSCFPWGTEDSCWVAALFMPVSSSQMLLSVMFFGPQFKNRWHSSLGFMTSAQYYKARVVQSCKTCTTNSEQLLRTGSKFSVGYGRAAFLRTRRALRGGKSKGQFLPSHSFSKHS